MLVNIQLQFVETMVIAHQIIIATEVFANLFVIRIKTVYRMRNVYKACVDQFVTAMRYVVTVKFVKIDCAKSAVETIWYAQRHIHALIASAWIHAVLPVNVANVLNAR